MNHYRLNCTDDTNLQEERWSIGTEEKAGGQQLEMGQVGEEEIKYKLVQRRCQVVDNWLRTKRHVSGYINITPQLVCSGSCRPVTVTGCKDCPTLTSCRKKKNKTQSYKYPDSAIYTTPTQC